MDAQALVECVREFHALIGRTETSNVRDVKESDYVRFTGTVLKTRAEHMLAYFKSTKDLRFLRLHLLHEELSEVCEAMSTGDERLLLDALGDLLYVLIGTAVEYDLPLIEAFIEIHRSNMTKRVQPADADGCRVRDKGPDYCPPDLQKVLNEYRARQES